MKLQLLVLAFSICITNAYSNACDSIGNSTKDGKTYIRYKVEAGNTFYGISSAYKISVEELKTINNIENLVLGTVILIPTQAKPSSHIVADGETLYSISKKYDVSTEDLKQLNQLTNSDLILGQTLILTEKTKVKTKIIREFQNIHVVSQGETLYQIAKKYKTSINELVKINDLKQDALQDGQKLFIPQQAYRYTLEKISKVRLNKSKSTLLDNDFCEIIAPIDAINSIVAIKTNNGTVLYARIIEKSTDGQWYGNEYLFKKINITSFSTMIDVEFVK